MLCSDGNLNNGRDHLKTSAEDLEDSQKKKKKRKERIAKASHRAEDEAQQLQKNLGENRTGNKQ